MNVRELAIPGGWEIIPQLHSDSRGTFFEWFTNAEFSRFTGHELDLRQANCSTSSAGALRGIHFAQVPPGQAKYVTCVRGAIWDVVVDIRVGSPTFGQWDAVQLDEDNRRSMYIAEGLGHAYLALQHDSTVMYLCSQGYDPGREHTLNVFDPALGIAWPAVDGGPTLSERDKEAPTLAEVQAAGLLPDWDETQAFIRSLAARLRMGGQPALERDL